MKLLEMHNIKKSFGELNVVQDISLSVQKGKVLAIIGPSGSGKSTMLRCAAMLEKIDSGAIEVCGMQMVHTIGERAFYAPPAELRKIRRCIGLVFQSFNLFPHFSVLRNVTEAMVRVAHYDKAEAEKKALIILEQMGLRDKSAAYPCELSGGQQQRVSIARALALSPEILFFDEPTSALDPELTGEILKVIKELARQKMTMVIVTHEMSFARDVADEIIFMDGGVIVEQGTAAELINNPRHERTKLFLNRYSST